MGAGVASAQQAAPPAASDDTVEAVVVTGFRNSLAQALNVKRSSAAAVDAIYAEDMAKFPDLNLSESIQRIPGVAISRDAGEGRQISVSGPGRPVHPRAHQRHGGPDHLGRHRRFGRHQPQPLVRLQRLRLGPLQPHHGAEDRLGRDGRRLAGRDRRPEHRPSVRQARLQLRGVGQDGL
ncbi:TonB-dependent receptor plug domain-containing protein [Caulobacter segnis]